MPNAVYEIFFIRVERMSKFEKIRELNKLPVFHISDEIFSEYGNIIDGINADEYIKFARMLNFPKADLCMLRRMLNLKIQPNPKKSGIPVSAECRRKSVYVMVIILYLMLLNGTYVMK